MKPERDREQEFREEAERLSQLAPDVQKQIVALVREPSTNPKVGKRDRREAAERADALERHLRRLNRQKKKM